jgi:peptidoglycan-associated lipoprotein
MFKTLARVALVALTGAWLVACQTHPPQTPPGPTQAPSTGPSGSEGSEQLPPSQAGGPIPGSQQDFVVNVGELVYFDFDKSDIRADAQPILASQAAWLRRYSDVRVRIEGNCDERGTREYNFALGARRAESVRDFLIAHGIAAGRITTISYGKERPIDPGTDDQAWARNRNARTAITEGAR